MKEKLLGGLVVAVAMAAALLAPVGAQAGKETLVVDLVNEPATLDPHRQWNPDSYYAYRNIYDNMVTRDAAGNIVPQVATSWQAISDSVIEFKIRNDIRFHDGTPLTADDVVFSVKRIIDPDFKSPQLGQFNQIIDAEKVDDSTVRLTTDGPYPPLLAQLVKLSIVSKAYAQSVGDEGLNRNPMGSGPYKFVEWRSGVKVSLEANEDYWRGAPPFAKAEFRTVPDASTRIADLRTGRADIAVSLNADQAAELAGDSNLQVLSTPTERVAYLMMNTLSGPTADVRVRQAIAYAVDRKLIIDALLGGYSKPVNELLTPAHFGYDGGSQGYPFDPAKAKALLAEAGLSDGVEVEMITAPVFDQRIVQAIQQQLSDVGITMNIAMSDMRTFLQRRRGSPEEFGNLVFGRWSCACQDADGVLFPMFHTDSIWSKYSNKDLDKLLEAARVSLDEDERKKDYAAANALIQADAPSIALYQAAAIYGARKELGWQPTPNESLFIIDMTWTE